MGIAVMRFARVKRNEGNGSPAKTRHAPNQAYGDLRIGDRSESNEQETVRTRDEVMTAEAPKRHWSISEMSMPVSGEANYLAPAAPSDALLTGRSRPISTQKAARNLQKEQDDRTAQLLAKGPIRFRVPTTADLKQLFASGAVPESVLKDRITVALQRMQKEGRLRSSAPVPDLINKIFPSPGTFDEAAFEAAVDV